MTLNLKERFAFTVARRFLIPCLFLLPLFLSAGDWQKRNKSSRCCGGTHFRKIRLEEHFHPGHDLAGKPFQSRCHRIRRGDRTHAAAHGNGPRLGKGTSS